MPKTNVGSPWEANFRSSIRTTPGLENWTVSNAGGKMQVRFRPSEGKAQAARLPLLWEQGNVNRATLLINRAAKALLDGTTDSLTAAIAIAQGNSTTMRIGVNWEEVAEGLRDVLMNHRNEILAKTWSDNYEPYISEALRLINSGDATDGPERPEAIWAHSLGGGLTPMDQEHEKLWSRLSRFLVPCPTAP